MKDKIIIVERGECTFVDKARKAQAAKAVAVIVIDNVPGSTSQDSPMFAMSGDGISDVTIPVVFVFQKDAEVLHAAIKNNTDLVVNFAYFSTGESLDFDCNFYSFQVNIMQMVELKKRIEKIRSQKAFEN